MTLPLARIRLRKTEKTTGISYVALARVRRLEDLLIDYTDFGKARLMNIKLPLYALKEDEITKLIIEKTKLKYIFKY
jgi:hypothetical protein